MTTTRHPTDAPHRGAHLHLDPRWVSVLLAMAAANLTYAVLHTGLRLDLSVVGPGGTTTAPNGLTVTLVSLGAGFAGWGLFALLRSVTTHARIVWRAIAGTVYALSLLGVLGATSLPGAAGLAVLHTVVAAILVVGIPSRRACTCSPAAGAVVGERRSPVGRA